MATRKEVLQLYKKALKLARTWRASDPMQTTQEKEYIVEEARRLFRKNINVGDQFYSASFNATVFLNFNVTVNYFGNSK